MQAGDASHLPSRVREWIPIGMSSGLWILLCVHLIRLMNFEWIDYRHWFHSDSAFKVLYALEILESGHFFPSDWAFANQDLPVLFGHLPIVPLLYFLPPGFWVHAVSGTLMTGVYLAGIWALSGLIQTSRFHRLLILVAFSSGWSTLTLENLFGQVSYGAILTIWIYLIVSGWHTLQQKSLGWGLIYSALTLLSGLSNPSRALIYMILPIAFGTLVFSLKFATVRIHALRFMGRTSVFFLLGVLWHHLEMSALNSHLAAADARWLDTDQMLSHLSKLPFQLLSVLTDLPEGQSRLMSKIGLYQASRLVAALTAFILIPLSIKRGLEERSPFRLFLAGTTVSALFLVLFLQVTTSIPDMSDPIQSARYLVPATVLLIFLTLGDISKRIGPNEALARGLLFFSLTVLPLFLPADWATSTPKWGQPQQFDDHRLGLAEFMKREGLEDGIGTYWNANALTVLTDGNVRVRPIHWVDGLPIPMGHLTAAHWFQFRDSGSRSFILLSSSEHGFPSIEKLASKGLHLVKTLRFEENEILVFDRAVTSLFIQ